LAQKTSAVEKAARSGIEGYQWPRKGFQCGMGAARQTSRKPTAAGGCLKPARSKRVCGLGASGICAPTLLRARVGSGGGTIVLSLLLNGSMGGCLSLHQNRTDAPPEAITNRRELGGSCSMSTTRQCRAEQIRLCSAQDYFPSDQTVVRDLIDTLHRYAASGAHAAKMMHRWREDESRAPRQSVIVQLARDVSPELGGAMPAYCNVCEGMDWVEVGEWHAAVLLSMR
jgi:hypothetical protein